MHACEEDNVYQALFSGRTRGPGYETISTCKMMCLERIISTQKQNTKLSKKSNPSTTFEIVQTEKSNSYSSGPTCHIKHPTIMQTNKV